MNRRDFLRRTIATTAGLIVATALPIDKLILPETATAEPTLAQPSLADISAITREVYEPSIVEGVHHTNLLIERMAERAHPEYRWRVATPHDQDARVLMASTWSADPNAKYRYAQKVVDGVTECRVTDDQWCPFWLAQIEHAAFELRSA